MTHWSKQFSGAAPCPEPSPFLRFVNMFPFLIYICISLQFIYLKLLNSNL